MKGSLRLATTPRKHRIRLNEMRSDPYPIEPGSLGTVRFVDSLGTVHVDWDDGRSLGVVPDEDDYDWDPPEGDDDHAT